MYQPPPDALAVLAFWFDPEHCKDWFAVNPSFDAAIREQFAPLVEQARAGQLAGWSDTPSGWLAWLIVLDQFPRNLYRQDPRAWMQDIPAQQLALWGIEEGLDRQLPEIQRAFAYMPLEHAENADLQRRSVALFESLLHSVPADQHDRFSDFLDYARRHQAVIARFGRFPTRNAVLKRISTAEERHYLAEPEAGF